MADRHSVKSGRARLAAQESGSGQVLVCLHAGVADQRMFERLHLDLTDRCRILSYDRRGFGETTTPDEPFSHVDDLTTILDARGVERAILVGCSQGGRIALDFALKHPQRVTGLFLVAPVVSGMPSPDLPPDLRSLDEEIDEAYEIEDLNRINALELKAWLDGPRAPPGRVGGAARELFSTMNMTALRHPELTRERQPPDAWGKLAAIDAPAQLCCGDLDFPWMVELSRHLAARRPNAEFRLLNGMAHMPFLEDPNLMTNLVQEFLTFPDS